MNTRLAEQVADAILYEGYVLYPYRASAPKNRVRWQVGLVAPRDFAHATGADPYFMQVECLAEIGRGAALTLRVRGLHVQSRSLERAIGPNQWQPVERLVVGDRDMLAWDEAVRCEFIRADVPLDARRSARRWSWTLDALDDVEYVHDHTGAAAARLVRRRRPVQATIRLSAEPCPPLVKIRIRIDNDTPCEWRALADRGEAVRQALAGTHAILAIENGAFVSALEPPAEWTTLAASCRNEQLFPVLAGARGSRDVMLASPIILYDYPAIAPESQGDFCDGTEIDELLTLRVRTLTDEEKREARATDPRAAGIVDRCEAASPQALGKLHGAVRSMESFLNPDGEPPPDAAFVDIGGTRVARGSHVRIVPARVSDSLDLCLRGRLATVTAVYRTLEDEPYVAVRLHDDPFGAEGDRYRRSLFFRPEELVPAGGTE